MVKVDFVKVLGIISILGYLGIFVNAVFGYNLAGVGESLLFIIIGVTLMLAGGIASGLKYLNDGLQARDITKLLTVMVGFLALLVGVLENPFVGITSDAFIGIKIVVSSLAIVVIAFETFYDDRVIG